MFYVKPRHVGEDGLGCWDPDRRDRLQPDIYRPVPENTYWRRLAQMGDVELRFETDQPEAETVEGYEAPPPVVAEVPAKKPAREGSDS